MFECEYYFEKLLPKAIASAWSPRSAAKCTLRERILCSNVCLNLYRLSKNFFRKPLLLIEAHHSLYFHWAHTSFNCMFEYVYCFEKFLLKAIGSAWSPPLSLLPQSAYFVQLYVWMGIMFWKTSSASHCFCFKPFTQCTFTDRIICSIVCLNVYIFLKNFLCEPLLLLEAHHSVHIHRAHILFNCMFECVECFEKLLLRVIASASSPSLSALSQSA